MSRLPIWAQNLAKIGAALVLALLAVAHRPFLNEPWTLLSAIVLTFGAGVVVHHQLKREDPRRDRRDSGELLSWVTCLLSLGGVQLILRAVKDPEQPGALLAMVPLLAQGLVLGGLISSLSATTGLTLTILLLGVYGAAPLPVLAVAWLLGVAGSWLINPLKRRSDLIRAVGILCGLAVLSAGTLAAARQMDGLSALEMALWGGVSALVASSIFYLGSTVLERLVGLTSDWTLLELCSPDHPVIQELCLRAPGTYAHSVMVGNLAETAARAVGANPVTVRAMAAFHDIGKLHRPLAFIENQQGVNLHDLLPPNQSADIIIRHVSEGLEMARRHHLPQVIIDGIAQHHGTTLAAWFYHKAQKSEMVWLEEDDFRYPGPKPQTKEAA
ncbi:MAG: HDIG domain-containing protein, partial [Fimbriimonadaceae bacterium]|nr:HDIG domain-containing protein [Fimbriimonadaceae bacterium]